jgi:quercetin dioxygenase-like cupin family protein
MKLYQWDSQRKRFMPGGGEYTVPAAEPVTVSSLEVSKGQQVSGHFSASEQMIFLLKGAWRVKVGTDDLIVRRNEAVVIPPGFEHSAEAIQDSFALQMVRKVS